MTKGSGELVPVSVMSRGSMIDMAGASLSQPDTVGLMGATLRAPIASSPQMLGLVGAASDPAGKADIDTGFGPAVLTGLRRASRFSSLSLLTHY